MKRSPHRRSPASSLGFAASVTLFCALVIGAGTSAFDASRAGATGQSPGAWTVDDSAGGVEARVAEGGSWVPLRPGAVFPGEVTIRTSPDGRATLSRDDDRIVLLASTEVQLPAADDGSSGTHIVQPQGKAFFEVGTRPGWSFSVDTPYLAVVVKGTKFGVGVSDDGTSVSVSEGRVQVGRVGGRTADVSAGQTARSGAAPGSDISVTRSSDSSAAPGAAPSPQGGTNTPDGAGGPGRGGAASGGGGHSGNGGGNSNSGNSGGDGGNNGGGTGNSGNAAGGGGSGNSGASGNSGNGGGSGNSGASGGNNGGPGGGGRGRN